MRRGFVLLTMVIVCACAQGAVIASTASSATGTPTLRERVNANEQLIAQLRDELEAQQEARDRLADSVQNDASVFTYVSGALIAIIALLTLVAGVLTFQSVKSYTQQRVDAQVEQAIAKQLAVQQQSMDKSFEELRERWDEKFAAFYQELEAAMRKLKNPNG